MNVQCVTLSQLVSSSKWQIMVISSEVQIDGRPVVRATKLSDLLVRTVDQASRLYH